MTANEFVLSSWTKSWRRWRRAKGERAGGTPAYRQAGRRYEGNVRNDSKSNGCPVPQTGTGRYRVKGTVKSKVRVESKVKDARLRKAGGRYECNCIVHGNCDTVAIWLLRFNFRCRFC